MHIALVSGRGQYSIGSGCFSFAFVGAFMKPDPKNTQIIKNCEDKIPCTVYCDGIRDPGNLGSILRTAAAAGFQNCWLSSGDNLQLNEPSSLFHSNC